MSSHTPVINTLDHECVTFSRYLMKQTPNSYVVNKYCEAHIGTSFLASAESSLFDRLLLRISAIHPLLAKLVDSYTSIFLKSAAVRKKWILLLAILESCAPTFQYFDVPDSSSKIMFFARITWEGVVFVVCLCLSTIIFMPLRLLFGVYSVLIHRD